MRNSIKHILAVGLAAASLAGAGLNVLAVPVTEFTPDMAITCTLDSTYDVNIPFGARSVWYSFTAPEDGTYAFFTSDSGDSDPVLLLYTSDLRLLNFNDNAGGEDNEFDSYVSVVLDSGETVYLQATITDYVIDDGSYQLHVTKGLAFYFDYDGEEFYHPWFNSNFYAAGGTEVAFRVSGDIPYWVTDSTNDFSEYTGGDLVYENGTGWESGYIDVVFAIEGYAFYKHMKVDLQCISTDSSDQEPNYDTNARMTDVLGESYAYAMVNPGDSYYLEEYIDPLEVRGLSAFWGYYHTPSEGPISLENPVELDGQYFLSDTIEDIQEFTSVRIRVYEYLMRADKVYTIFVSDPDAPAMDIDTDYPFYFDIPSNTNYDNYQQIVYSFTPRASGSFTFSVVNRIQGYAPICIFNEDNELIGLGTGGRRNDFRYASYNRTNLQYYYLYYGNEESNVWVDRNGYVQNGRIIDTASQWYDPEITIDLIEGQTYYIAMGEGYFNDLPHHFDLRITWNGEEPYPTPTPAPTNNVPTSAPTSAPTSNPAPSDAPVVSSRNYNIGDFVERLYTVALGRASDPAGKQDWIDAVTLRGQTGADLARGFLYSPEFLQKNVSNEDFVRVLYRTFFDREADADGLAGWVAVLDNGGSKEGVIEGFINSTEWANLCLLYGVRCGGTGTPSIQVEPNQQTIDFATRLYTTCLGRAADENGLMAWARQLANQRDSGTGAAHGFFFSSEFTNQNVSNDEYVNRLYRTFMGREADEAGFNAWVAQLNDGVSREEVFNGFAQSPEFTRICADYGIIR